MTPGVFTDAVLGAIVVNEKTMLGAGSRITELAQPIVAGAAILGHSSSEIVEIGSGTSCMSATIYVHRASGLDKGNKTIGCEVTSTVKDGTDGISLAKQALVNFESFFIPDILCKNDLDFAKRFAYLSSLAKINLEVKLSKMMVGMLSTNADTATLSNFENPVTLAGSVTQMQKQYFTADVLADLKLMAEQNGIVQPRILNGTNFYKTQMLNEFASNGCCSNNDVLDSSKHFEIFWDVMNVEPVTTAKSTFIFDMNSILFWSSPVYDKEIGIEDMMTKGAESGDRYHYVDTLPRLTYFADGSSQKIYVDVRAQRSCVPDALGVPRDGWAFEFMVWGDVKANLPNQNNKKGIYRIDQVANA